MGVYVLDTKIKESISKQIGIPFEKISNMDCEDIDTVIEKRIGHKLTFKKRKDFRRLGRGSVYLALDRLFSMKDIDKKIKRI